MTTEISAIFRLPYSNRGESLLKLMRFFLTPYIRGYIIRIEIMSYRNMMEDCRVTRTFIEVPYFTKRWHELGLTDDDLTKLQSRLLKNPQAGPPMEWTGGICKVRAQLEENKGKSSGARVCYVDFTEFETIYLILVFAKKDQDNLTQSEKNQLKRYVKELKQEMRKNRQGGNEDE